jgi:hypothetical protein
MESVLRYLLDWPAVDRFVSANAWAWPLAETVHFIGLILLIGAVGLFDLRILGVAKSLPIAPLRRLLPWGVLGFTLCVITGFTFIAAMKTNAGMHPYDVLVSDTWLQVKLLFIFFAGVNLGTFYLTGMSRAVEFLKAGDDAPLLAKAIAGASLFLWVGVIYLGRLIPWDLG